MVAMESAQKLKQGGGAPDFSLKGIDGKLHSLADYSGSKALLIIFMCNHCPYVKAKVNVMNDLHEKFSPKGLAMAGINSNDPAAYPGDSFENMKLFARERKIRFDYLFDETQEVAKAYGAVCTPDPFLFDSHLKLAYHGRLNNAMSPEAVPTVNDMEDAIFAILEGKKPKQFFLPSIGCSIKWRK